MVHNLGVDVFRELPDNGERYTLDLIRIQSREGAQQLIGAGERVVSDQAGGADERQSKAPALTSGSIISGPG